MNARLFSATALAMLASSGAAFKDVMIVRGPQRHSPRLPLIPDDLPIRRSAGIHTPANVIDWRDIPTPTPSARQRRRNRHRT